MKQIVPFLSQTSSADQSDWLSALRRAMPAYLIVPFIELAPADRDESEFAIVANPCPTELAQLPSLKWIQSLWAGVETLVNSTLDSKVKIVKLSDARLSETMAEAALASTYYLHREMPAYRKQQERRDWLQRPVLLATERTVGVLGLGALGDSVARKISSLGFDVLGWSRSAKPTEPLAETVGETEKSVENRSTATHLFHGPEGLLELLSRTEILIVLLPLTQETNGLLNKQMLARLPKRASVINFARGPILVESDLIEMLDSDHLSHAVLDVFDKEPLDRNHRYWKHPDITIWPHVAAPTDKQSASTIVANNIEAYLSNGTIPASVDRKVQY